MNEELKKPTHYITGENGQPVPVYEDELVGPTKDTSSPNNEPLYYKTGADGQPVPVESDATVASEETTASFKLEDTANTENTPNKEPTQTEELSTIESGHPKAEHEDESSEIAEPTEDSKPNQPEKDSGTKPEEDDLKDTSEENDSDQEKVDDNIDTSSADQQEKEIQAATKVVDPETSKKKSKRVKLGVAAAGLAVFGGLIGSIASKNNGGGENKSATSTTAEASNVSAEKQQELIKEGQNIISKLDKIAEAYLGEIRFSDKDAWDQALALAPTDPDKAAELLANTGSSQQLFDLAVALNENVWTPEYTRVSTKLLSTALGSNVDFSITAEDVKDYMVNTGVYDKLPRTANQDKVTAYSMFQTINSMGEIEFANNGVEWVKQYLIDTQQGNINIAPTHVSNGYITQEEAAVLVKGSQQYIDNVNSKLDAVMQS